LLGLGDLIATGTPAEVGVFIGRLESYVVEEA